jgi:WD40 repeat protein
VWAIALSPSGKWLAAGTEDGVIEIWDAATGEKRASLRGHRAGVTAVSFSRDENSLASGSADRSARLWNLETHAERGAFRVNSFVTAVALSADSQWIAAGSSDRRVKLWNLKTPKRTAGFRGKQEPQALAFSPEGGELAVAGSGGLKLWNVGSGREIQSLSTASAAGLAFTGDGHCLALIAGPQGLKLWDATGSRQLNTFPSPESIRASAISQNGKTVAFSAGGRTISLDH